VAAVVDASAATDVVVVAAAAAAAAARVGLSGVCLCARGAGDFEAIRDTLRGDVHNQTEAPLLPFITAEPPVV
jgi:hypothetical protein